MADKKIVVTLPLITALENMFSFLNNAFFRCLNRGFAQKKLGYIFKNTVKEKAGYELGHLRQFITKLREKSAEASEIIDDELHFDYKLKDGICKNMNASFLLKKMKIV